MNKLTGKVLWYDKRDGHGIIKGDDGFEYYVDISVLVPRTLELKHDMKLKYILNTKIRDCRCATEVEAA